MRNILLTVLIFIIPLQINAQKQGSFWFFGDHAGLDFKNGNPVSVTNGATYNGTGCPSEGTATISDSSGAILFYTNGQQVWNKLDQIMPNGDGLLGNMSSTQAAIIIPQPNSSRYFYIFTTDDFCNNHLINGLRYSVIDMCLDKGFGDVISGKKNVKILDTVAEKITAVRHRNGVDYWIITHKYYSDAFYAFHLSTLGIINTVISHIGSFHPSNMTGNGGAIGQIKVSPNGQYIAIVNGQAFPNIAEYFNFNKSTGTLSNCVSIQTNPNYSYYGVSFSPDNTKLYISCWLNNNGVYQFDLNAGGGNPDSVRNSKSQISDKAHFAIQLGLNGKIYLTGSNLNFLDVINDPNSSGINCNFQDSGIYLLGRKCGEGLPNFIDSYDYSNKTENCQSIIDETFNGNKIILFQNEPNPFGFKTIIRYFIPEETQGSIYIIFNDMFGKEISRSEILNRGIGSIDVCTEKITSGIYSYSIIIGGIIIDTKKMLKNSN